MKPRSREINIFNMSLLDILCGALGAFCFLMLVLFPFYSQDKGVAKAPDVPAGIDPKTFEEAKARIQQLEDLVKKFQDYSAQADAQEKREEAQNRQLQARNDQLEMRKPLLAVGRFTLGDADFVQVYIEDDRQTTKGAHQAKVDATKPQDSIFNGDFTVFGEGAGMSYFLIRDTSTGEYRVFLKIIKHKASDAPIRGYVALQVQGQFEVSPTVYAAQEHTAIPIAVVSVDKDLKQSIKIVVPKEATTAPPASQ
jgi:hypothetical protein